MVKFSNLVFFLMAALLGGSGICDTDNPKKLNYLNRAKRNWLVGLLSRTRRDLSPESPAYDNGDHNEYRIKTPASSSSSSSNRPCPSRCNCNFDTMNCNDLLARCAECLHWSKIDFNQIREMRARAFEHFRFAANQTTHLIIYKLLNSTLDADTFAGMHVERHAHLEVTFQYNSLIIFGKHVLRGLRLAANATLVFNFPYTSQVVFAARWLEGVRVEHASAKIVIRILKSFSVKFAGESKQRGGSGLGGVGQQHWSWSTGQLVIDIKSTHLVRFDEHSFARMRLSDNAKFFIDLELVEKLMLQRYSFANLELMDASRAVFFAKQITFIDFRAHSFSSITLRHNARLEIYLEELTSSLCLQRNVFANMNFAVDNNNHRHHSSPSFNFSVINSKNVQLMHDSFANISLANPHARLFLGLYNMPSFLLLFQNERYFKSFLIERLKYLDLPLTVELIGRHQTVNPAANQRHRVASHIHHHSLPHYIAQSFANNGFFIDESILSSNRESHLLDIESFYVNNKQIYSYNLSIEKNCFFNMTMSEESSSPAQLQLAADNVHTVLLDDQALNGSSALNVEFVLNVRHFVLSPRSLSPGGRFAVRFLKEPRTFKLALHDDSSTPTASRLSLSISGLSFAVAANSSVKTSTTPVRDFDDYFDDSGSVEDRNSAVRRHPTKTIPFFDFCALSRNKNLQIRVDRSSNVKLQQTRLEQKSSSEEQCSCELIRLMYSQIRDLSSSEMAKVLSWCTLSNDLVRACMNDCGEKKEEQNSSGDYLRSYTKFWQFCISESEPSDSADSGLFDPSSSLLDSQFRSPLFHVFDSVPSSSRDSAAEPSSSSSLSRFDHRSNSQLLHGNNELGSSVGNSELPRQPSFEADEDEAALNNGRLAKIVGIVVVCFVCGLVLFMITVNIVQYKFRNDELFDDLEYSSASQQNVTASRTSENSTCKGPRANSQQNDCEDEGRHQRRRRRRGRRRDHEDGGDQDDDEYNVAAAENEHQVAPHSHKDQFRDGYEYEQEHEENETGERDDGYGFGDEQQEKEDRNDDDDENDHDYERGLNEKRTRNKPELVSCKAGEAAVVSSSDSAKSSGFVSASNSNSTITPVHEPSLAVGFEKFSSKKVVAKRERERERDRLSIALAR